MEENNEMNLIKYNAREKLMRQTEQAKITYEEAKKDADKNMQNLPTDMRVIYEHRMHKKSALNTNLKVLHRAIKD